MNSILEDEFDGEFPGSHDLRDQLMDMITDADLAYKLPGLNPTLGELCEKMGHTQQVYAQCFKTLKQDWSYTGYRPDAANSVASLKAWHKKLDAELYAAVSDLSEDEVQNKHVDRGRGFTPSLYVQFQIYHEAVLIFYAKASVYLKALNIKFTDDWQIGIG